MTDGPDQGWVRLSNRAWRSQKLRRVTPVARLLFILSLSYLGDVRQDGYLTEDDLTDVATMNRLERHGDLVAEMVTEGLLVVTEAGYGVPDWLEWQRSSDEIQEYQRKRREAGRRGGQARVATAGRGPGGKFTAAPQVNPGLPGKPPGGHQAESESEAEKENASRSSRSARRKPETPWPNDFALTGELKRWAAENTPGLKVQDEFRAFHQHALSCDRRLRDWPAGFRTWLLKGAKREQERKGPADQPFGEEVRGL